MRRHFSTENLVGMAQASLNRLSRLLYRPAGAGDDEAGAAADAAGTDPSSQSQQQQQQSSASSEGQSNSSSSGVSPEFTTLCKQLTDAMARRNLTAAEERSLVERCFRSFASEVLATTGGGGVFHSNSNDFAVLNTPRTGSDEITAKNGATSSIRALTPSDAEAPPPPTANAAEGMAARNSYRDPAAKNTTTTTPSSASDPLRPSSSSSVLLLLRMSKAAEQAWLTFFQLCYAVFQSAPEVAEQAALDAGLFTTLIDVVDCTVMASSSSSSNSTAPNSASMSNNVNVNVSVIPTSVTCAAFIILHDLFSLRPSVAVSAAVALRTAIIQRANSLVETPVSVFVEQHPMSASSNSNSSAAFAPTPQQGHSRTASSSAPSPLSSNSQQQQQQKTAVAAAVSAAAAARTAACSKGTLPLLRIAVLVQRAVLRAEATHPEMANEAKCLLFGGGGVDALLRAFEHCQAVLDEHHGNNPAMFSGGGGGGGNAAAAASSSNSNSSDAPSLDYAFFAALVVNTAALVGALVRSNIPHKEELIIGAEALVTASSSSHNNNNKQQQKQQQQQAQNDDDQDEECAPISPNYSAVRTRLVCALFSSAASCIDAAAQVQQLFDKVPNQSIMSPFMAVAVGGQLGVLPGNAAGVIVGGGSSSAAASSASSAGGGGNNNNKSSNAGPASPTGVSPLSVSHHHSVLRAESVSLLVGELAETAVELCTTGELSHSRVTLLRQEARQGGTAFAADAATAHKLHHHHPHHLHRQPGAPLWLAMPPNWDLELGSSVLFSWRFASAVANCFFTAESATVLLRIVQGIDSGRGPLAESALRCICASLICLCRANPANAETLLRAGAFPTLFRILVPGVVFVRGRQGGGDGSSSSAKRDPTTATTRRQLLATTTRSEALWSVGASLLHSLVSHNVSIDGLRLIMAAIGSLKNPSTAVITSSAARQQSSSSSADKQRELCEFVELCLSTILSMNPLANYCAAANTTSTTNNSGSSSSEQQQQQQQLLCSTAIPYLWFEGRRAFASCILSSMPGGWNGYSVSMWVQPSLVWADGILLYSITESSAGSPLPASVLAVLLVANGNMLQLVVRAAQSREQVTMTTIPDSSFPSSAASPGSWHHIAINHNMSGLTAFVDGRKCINISAVQYLSKKSKAGKFYLSFGGISASAGASGLPTSFGMFASGQFYDGYLGDKEVEKIAAAGPSYLQEQQQQQQQIGSGRSASSACADNDPPVTPLGRSTASSGGDIMSTPGGNSAADGETQLRRRASSQALPSASVDSLVHETAVTVALSNATEVARLCAMPCYPESGGDAAAVLCQWNNNADVLLDCDDDGGQEESNTNSNLTSSSSSSSAATISDRFAAYPLWAGPKVDHGEVSSVSAHIGPSVAQVLEAADVLGFCISSLSGIGRLASRSSIVILCADFLAAYFLHCPVHGRDNWAVREGPARLGAELLLWNSVPSHVTFALFSIILTHVPPVESSSSSSAASASASTSNGNEQQQQQQQQQLAEKKYFARHPSSAQVLHLVLDVIFGPSSPRAASAMLRELANFLNVEANIRYFCDVVGMETFLAYTTVCDNSCIDDFVTVVERIVKQPRELGELLKFLSWKPLAEPQVVNRLDRMRCAFLCMLYDIVKANEVKVKEPESAATSLLNVATGAAPAETTTYPIAELIFGANGVTELVTVVKISEHETLRICAMRLLCMTTYCSPKARQQFDQLGGVALLEEALLYHVAQSPSGGGSNASSAFNSSTNASSSNNNNNNNSPATPSAAASTIMSEHVFQCLVKASLEFYRPNNEAISGSVLSKLRAASGGAGAAITQSGGAATSNTAAAGAGGAAAAAANTQYPPDGSTQAISFSGHVPSMLELRIAGGPSPAPPAMKHSIISTTSSDGLESKLRSDDGYNATRDRLECPAYVHTILRLLHGITEQLRPGLTRCFAAHSSSHQQQQHQTATVAQQQHQNKTGTPLSPSESSCGPSSETTSNNPTAALTPSNNNNAVASSPVVSNANNSVAIQALASLVIQVLKYLDRLLSLQPNVAKLLAHSGSLALEELFHLARPFCAVVWAQHMDGTPMPFMTTGVQRRDGGGGSGLDTPRAVGLGAATSVSAVAAASSSSSSKHHHSRSISDAGFSSSATTTGGPLIFFSVTPAATTIAALVRNITRSIVLVDTVKNSRTTVRSCVVGEYISYMPVLQRVALEEAFRDMAVRHRVENLDAADATVALKNLETLLSAVEEHGYVSPLPLSLGMELVHCVDSMAAESTPAIRTKLMKTRIVELRNRLALHLLAKLDYVANESYAGQMVSVAQSCRSDANATPLVLLKHVGDCVRDQNAEALMSSLSLLRAVFAAEEEQRSAIIRIVGNQEVCDALIKTHRVAAQQKETATTTAAAAAGGKQQELVPTHFASWVKEHPSDWEALQKRLTKQQKPIEAELKARADRREKESQARLKQQVQERERRAQATSKAAAAAAQLLSESERKTTAAMEQTFARVQFERVQRFEKYALFEQAGN